jgi:hypothetical protein
LPIAEVAVRQYVRKRKQELGGRVAFVPQSYDWGLEAQVDWFEAVAKLAEEPCKLQFFAMRSMASGDAFHHERVLSAPIKKAQTIPKAANRPSGPPTRRCTA